MTPAARAILERGTLCYVGARTAAGLHVTPLVYAVHAGRIWVTTARSSTKARAWRRDPLVAGLVGDGSRAVAFRGRVKMYDALDPRSWPATVTAAPRLVAAATKFSLKNARFFAGYAVDARRVPLTWMPPGRIFASIEPLAGRVLEEGAHAGGWGEWERGCSYGKSFARAPRGRSLDLVVPKAVRSAIGESGAGALALEASSRFTILPARWRRRGGEGTYEADVPLDLLDLTGAAPGAAGALVVDRASTWRASAMKGLLIQGPLELFSLKATTRGRPLLRARVDESRGLARIRPRRVVWWQGWSSGSATARRTETA